MLKGVLGLWEQAGFVEELRSLQAREPVAKFVLGVLCDGDQQHQRHVLADGRSRLEEILVAGWEAIDARSQHRLHRRGHLEVRDGLPQTIDAPLANNYPGFDQGADTLLKEKRVAIRSLDEEAHKLGHGCFVAEERLEQGLSAWGGQGIEPDLRIVRFAAPGVLVFRPIVDQE